MRAVIFQCFWMLTFASAIYAEEQKPIWVHMIITTNTDALAHSKEMGFVPQGDVSPLPTSYYFVDEQNCKNSMIERLIRETGRKDITLLCNGIEERGQFITSWRNGELYSHHSCIQLFPK